MTAVLSGFAARVLRWQSSEGRNDLPWNQGRDPYRVWLSEIMLQQTQVVTVVAYFERFIARFPDVQALARAPLDDVMALWAGLGYYSRARNLHRCAGQVVQQHGGRFPDNAKALQTLPGIGRSTAAAIAAFCFGERVAILDGNVKRVLTRVLGFERDLSVAAHEKELWSLAESLLPGADLQATMPRYTQGLMDLGATLCTPRAPVCEACPVRTVCVARRDGTPMKFPVRSRKLRRSSESLWLLQAQSGNGDIWLHRRAQTGIWAGLHCLPVFSSREALAQAVPPQHRAALEDAPTVTHVLTHKDLFLHPVEVILPGMPPLGDGSWCSTDQQDKLGLPAPVRKLIDRACSRPVPGGESM